MNAIKQHQQHQQYQHQQSLSRSSQDTTSNHQNYHNASKFHTNYYNHLINTTLLSGKIANDNNNNNNSNNQNCIVVNDDDDDVNQSKVSSNQQFSFGKCKVCSDRATGIHYGIASCEACKVSSIN